MLITDTVDYGGCAAKFGMGELHRYLASIKTHEHSSDRVGLSALDDAAVIKFDDKSDLCATIDFITPIVPDPYIYGQIAAANSVSDIYAMGGTPRFSLLIACLDPRISDDATYVAMFQGAFDKAEEAGAPIVGGHTILNSGIKLGLSVTGAQTEAPWVHANACVGDRIYLTKPIGTGLYSNAVKQNLTAFSPGDPEIQSMVTLNDQAVRIARNARARCVTDITGFGLLGHLSNISRASSVRIDLFGAAVPTFGETRSYYEAGMSTSGAGRNRSALTGKVEFDGCPEWLIGILLDPQTSGGLAILTSEDLPGMEPIGRVVEGSPGITVNY
ncbi:MAG: selenide, water dikinase SelD [Fimbriimonas sp.]|nr:selenide, water dikinase SelD [Fimbriimonas sp.]